MTLILRGTLIATATLLPDVNCWPYRSGDFAVHDGQRDAASEREVVAEPDREDAKGIIDSIGR